MHNAWFVFERGYLHRYVSVPASDFPRARFRRGRHQKTERDIGIPICLCDGQHPRFLAKYVVLSPYRQARRERRDEADLRALGMQFPTTRMQFAHVGSAYPFSRSE
jgi:hypothetical protein